MSGIYKTCDDDRFELIDKAKARLLEATNIEMRPDEMAVIDSILFRCWQMGWLDQLRENCYSELFGTPGKAARTLIAVRGVCESGPCSPNCPFSGAPVCPSSFEPSDYDALLEWLESEVRDD